MRVVCVLLILAFLSCKVQRSFIEPGDNYKIINDVIERKSLSSHYLLSETLNKSLIDDLKNDIHFENEKYHEFGTLRNVFPDTIIDEVFSNEQITYIKAQLHYEVKWNESNLEKVKIVTNVSPKDTYFQLSVPAYTKGKNYALIKYAIGNNYYQVGRGGVLLCKKENNKWIFIKGFFDTIE